MQSSKRMINTFKMVRDSLEDKSILAHPKLVLSHIQFHQEENILGHDLKEKLTDLFSKLPRYSQSPQAE